jgi:hypothetical protein
MDGREAASGIPKQSSSRGSLVVMSYEKLCLVSCYMRAGGEIILNEEDVLKVKSST